nr:hypothetical protein BaRGS_009033 [Batillaria attramentaria]
MVDKAMELRYIGGVYGGNVKPTPFLCLILKMLQIQPEKDIVVEFIRNEDFKYVRALGAAYMRLTGTSLDCYKYLEPLYYDYRKMRRMNREGKFELIHMDEYIDQLLREERAFDIILPRIQKRNVLEESNQLETRVSAIEEDIEEMETDEEEELLKLLRRKRHKEDDDRKRKSKKSRSDRDRHEGDKDKDRHRSDRDKHDRHDRDRGRERRHKDKDRENKDRSSHHHSRKDRLDDEIRGGGACARKRASKAREREREGLFSDTIRVGSEASLLPLRVYRIKSRFKAIVGNRVFLWGFSALAISGNAGVLIYRLIAQSRGTTSRAFGVLVSNLCAADFLMGVYMMMIGSADEYFRGVYVSKETEWRTSGVCKMAGFLAFLSSEMSAFVICLVTLDRLLVLCFPLKTEIHMSGRAALGACGAAWAVAALLAAVPLIVQWDFYGQSGICLPLPITRRNFPGQEYAFAVFIVLNFVLFLFIGAGQVFIFYSIRRAGSKAGTTRRHQETAIARRLFLIVFTDFLCWFPIGLMGLLASSGTPIPGVVNVWAAIFVLPLNSALNPFMYTLNSLAQRWKQRRLEKQAQKALGRLQAEIPKWPDSSIEQLMRICLRTKAVKKERVLQWLGYKQEDVTDSSNHNQLDTAMELRYIGGVYGGNVKPTPFLCLILKMLQIQPEKDIVVEFIRNEDFKLVPKRNVLEESNQLETRVSAIEEDIEEMETDKEEELLKLLLHEHMFRVLSISGKIMWKRKSKKSRSDCDRHEGDKDKDRHRSDRDKHDRHDRDRGRERRHKDKDRENKDRGSHHHSHKDRLDDEIREANELRAKLGMAPLKP